MKNSQLMMLAGVGVLGYVLLKSQTAAASTSTATGSGSNAANYRQGYNGYSANAAYAGGGSGGNGGNYSGAIGAAYNYVSGNGSSSGSYYA